MDKEIRTRAAEFITADDTGELILEGYAAKFDEPTVLYKRKDGTECKEVINRGAFDNCDFSKCCLKYNHDEKALTLARVRGGSLALNVDNVGLHFVAKLFPTTSARDVYTVVKCGGLDQCSFAFVPSVIEYNRESKTNEIKSISMVIDVSLVDNPAYEGTEVKARSFFEMEFEKETAEAEERAKEVARVSTLIKIMTMKGETATNGKA